MNPGVLKRGRGSSRIGQAMFVLALMSALAACGGELPSAELPTDTPELKALGQAIYFDTSLSSPPGQSCASCHADNAGFADPNRNLPVSEGVISGRFGNRNSPTTSYAAFIPPFQLVNDIGGDFYIGGQFMDGRASTLEDQAKAPFLNPLEMNNPDKASVVLAVSRANYAADFRVLFGDNIFNNVDRAYDRIAEAIAAFERSTFFSPFSSKFDAFQRGVVMLTASELRGSLLFIGKAECARCHESPAGGADVGSDFRYHNIGVPPNPNNPFLYLGPEFNPEGMSFVDMGLGGVLGLASENGKFRTPTMRNIALTPPYMHNGVFDTLEQVIQFYNRRDVDGVVPEVADNIDNIDNIGELGLTDAEVQDLIAFLNTMTDGFTR
ncbi:MAG: c-type cytochrome [Gammaproteobacteria bacterium]|nr:c-type cytochrome [Gammaproteobacteria bacterium]